MRASVCVGLFVRWSFPLVASPRLVSAFLGTPVVRLGGSDVPVKRFSPLRRFDAGIAYSRPLRGLKCRVGLKPERTSQKKRGNIRREETEPVLAKRGGCSNECGERLYFVFFPSSFYYKFLIVCLFSSYLPRIHVTPSSRTVLVFCACVS